jgi:hypothetical protein
MAEITNRMANRMANTLATGLGCFSIRFLVM